MREMKDATRQGVESGSEVEPAEADYLECGHSSCAPPNGARAGTAGDDFDWDISVPLLTNRFILYDPAKMLLWTFL